MNKLSGVLSKKGKKVVSSPHRRTLTLNSDTYGKIDALRGGLARSAYVEKLVGADQARVEREKFIRQVNAYYTEEVKRETLKILDEMDREFPIEE
jgi:hypothetical protein